MERAELIAFLKLRNVPLEKWGTGEAKTIDHFLEEINTGETALFQDDGKIFRCVDGGSVNVYYDDNGRLLKLKEQKQVFIDGRVKSRNLPTSVGEKIRNGESREAAARRALKEELDIVEELPLIQKGVEIEGPVPSVSFPGIYSKYIFEVFDVFLPAHLYKPEGYVEKQKDKTNYYVWIPVQSPKSER